MKSLARWIGLSVFTMALFGTLPSASAGVDVSFGVRAPIHNDGDLFFNISSRYFDRPVTVVDTWGQDHQKFGDGDRDKTFNKCPATKVIAVKNGKYHKSHGTGFASNNRRGRKTIPRRTLFTTNA